MAGVRAVQTCEVSLSITEQRLTAETPASVSVYRVADARSADLQSAVSQVCNLRIVGKIPSLGSDRRLADYKSAIRQIENLRYGKQIPAASQSSTTNAPCLACARGN